MIAKEPGSVMKFPFQFFFYIFNDRNYLILKSYFSISDYMKFLEDHCRQRAYMFQIRKCQNINCCRPSRSGITFPWVPDPIMQVDKNHYEPFEKVLGTDTNESDKHSAQNTKTSVVAEQMQVKL